MSGHSKWSTIKHKKAALDSKRGKVFGQVAKMIRVAVKESNNGNPDQNPSLRVALDKARAANMPKAKIDKAIEKGLGRTAQGATYDEVVYEGFGPAGVGVMIKTVTDNRNRTSAEIRLMLEKSGGSLGGPGSVSYMLTMTASGEPQIVVGIPVEDVTVRDKVEQLVEQLENHDDVEAVVTNMAFSETE